MRKNLYSILIIICITFMYCTNQEYVKNDLEKSNLKGKIKRVTNINYFVIEKFGELEKGEKTPFLNFELYNEKGFLTEESFFRVKLEYNSKNQLIKKYSLIDTTIYKYDNKGLKIEENLYSKKLIQKIKYLYDDNENMIESRTYESSGELKGLNKFRYDGKKCIEDKGFYKTGEFMNLTKYKYDNKGNEIEKIFFFDENIEGKIKKNTQKFDENNNVIETSFYSNLYGEDYYTSKTIYKKFDKNGNWIEAIEYFNNKPNLIITREIDYYN